jgi:hypothetical protein
LKKALLIITLLLFALGFASCEKPGAVKSDKAELLSLELEINGIDYLCSITGNSLSLDTSFPYGTSEAKVKTIVVSEGATSSIHAGDVIPVKDTGFDIKTTAEDRKHATTYHLSFSIETPSHEANLLSLTLTFQGIQYQTQIDEHNIVVDEEFAYNATGMVAIDSFTVSKNAEVNITKGQNFDINQDLSIQVVAQDGVASNTYLLKLRKDDEGRRLIESASFSSCAKWSAYSFQDLKLENNLWNSNQLEQGSFSQCIYQYQNNDTLLFGWEWSFQENQHGVNAYPEIIYGWKPWHKNSTTDKLPTKISDLSTLKVNYEAKMFTNDGGYNLAFDNWICSTSDVSPGNIRFELMIWEDRQQLEPFGDYQQEVTTSNGVYKFYRGEPNWEPPGSNWTYLAFVRVDNRKRGRVDIDELINFLVSKQIVPSNYYLASIEFGNELGNSKGYTVMKQFDIELE